MNLAVVFLALAAVLPYSSSFLIGSSAPIVVATSNRCNSNVADNLDIRVRAMEGKAVEPRDFNLRFAELQNAIYEAGSEATILKGACATADQLDPLVAQLASTSALALAIQADAALQKFGAVCPAAKNAMTAGFLASAWLSLAKAPTVSSAIAPPVAAMVPKIQARAAAIGMVLPSFADTSAYWRDQMQAKGTAAVEPCPQ